MLLSCSDKGSTPVKSLKYLNEEIIIDKMDKMDLIQEITDKLASFSKIENIFMKSRGNNAIRDALTLLQDNISDNPNSKKTILVQDQGGWLRYLNFPEKYGFQVKKIKTDYGIIDLDSLDEESKNADAILYENPAGYFADQPLDKIYEICKKNNCYVILDVTGCLSDEELCNGEYCDILISSFGKGKAVNLGYGGFIGIKNPNEFNKNNVVEDFDQSYLEELLEKLNEVEDRLKQLYSKSIETKKKVKERLPDFTIIHENKKGINVIVKFKDEDEKNKIIDFCNDENLEYTECPRYIRVEDDAISIEIKRLD